MRYKNANKNVKANWEWFVEYNLGSIKCERCGYEGVAIDVHHIKVGQKKNVLDTLAVNINKPSHVFRNWIQNINYALLCSNCHRELHAGLWKVDDIKARIASREQSQKATYFPNRNEQLCQRIIESVFNRPLSARELKWKAAREKAIARERARMDKAL